MRGSVLLITVLLIVIWSCSDGVVDPGRHQVSLEFASERLSVPVWPDSTAYVARVSDGRLEFVGFYAACWYSMTGRIVKADEASIVVDAEISQLPASATCFVPNHTRYQGVLSGLAPGDHRIILEHVIRHFYTGELMGTATVLDTLITVP